MSSNTISIDTQHGDMIVCSFLKIILPSMMYNLIIMEKCWQHAHQIIQLGFIVLKMVVLSSLLKLMSISLFCILKI